jgi:hypothetical protein
MDPDPVAAGWGFNGTTVCRAAGGQGSPAIASDGSGGAIVAWVDERLGPGMADIYVRRVDAGGNPLWMVDGVSMCTAPAQQLPPVITSDDAGGVIVAWEDWRSGTGPDIYVQRVDAFGDILWAQDGVRVASESDRPAIASDGVSGAIVTWRDYRGGPVSQDIYAQRLDASGAILWTSDGVALCARPGRPALPEDHP